MSDAMSEIYKGQRERKREQDRWKVQLNKSKLLSDKYDSILERMERVKTDYKKTLKDLSDELDETRDAINAL